MPLHFSEDSARWGWDYIQHLNLRHSHLKKKKKAFTLELPGRPSQPTVIISLWEPGIWSLFLSPISASIRNTASETVFWSLSVIIMESEGSDRLEKGESHLQHDWKRFEAPRACLSRTQALIWSMLGLTTKAGQGRQQGKRGRKGKWLWADGSL